MKLPLLHSSPRLGPSSLRYLLAFGLLFSVLAGSVSAQMKVAVEMEHDVYLRFQPTLLKVTVLNRAAKPMNIREIGGTMQMKVVVKGSDGRRIDRREDRMLFDRLFIVHPQETGSKSIDLFQTYKVSKSDNYTAYVLFTVGSRQYKSETVSFEVRNGVLENKLELFEPARTFKLLRLDRDKGQFLCLSVFNSRETLAYGVYELGRMVQGRESQIEVDGNDQVHILHASAPDRYIHSVFTAKGRPVDQDLHKTEFGEARLNIRSGKAKIVGTRGGTPR